MQDNVNQAIRCSVTTCAHHGKDQNYCTLKEIKVGCTGVNAAKCGQTECASFDLGTLGTGCHCDD